MMLTSMLPGVSSTQCAAVSTAVGEISDPPHTYELPSAYSSDRRATQGDVTSGVGACGGGGHGVRERYSASRQRDAAAETHRRATHDALLRRSQHAAAALGRCARRRRGQPRQGVCNPRVAANLA